MPEWECITNPMGGHNYVRDFDGFYISFNPTPTDNALTALIDLTCGKDRAPAETALVEERPDGERIFYILNGDYRADYDRLAEDGFDACLAFYESRRAEHGSFWSTPVNAQ